MIKYHQIFIFCDDSVIRSIKNKIDKLIVESNEENTAVRIDIIHFDNILLNLFNNGHSPFYSVSSAKDLDFYTNKLHANIQHINKIQVNDPLLLYYGFDAGTVITQHSISDTTSGESEKLLLVIK
jgi:DNA-directed RNA polymerase subunit H (RpoH/RPB5)